ncbi:hypothetical protein DMX02_04495 [Pseudomonas jessenii]|nr:hypothetical protein DMX02_04495 [Pseudomonas jessenii]
MSKHGALRTTKQFWERACSRRRFISQHLYRLTRPLREQARSHRGFMLVLRGLQCRSNLRNGTPSLSTGDLMTM